MATRTASTVASAVIMSSGDFVTIETPVCHRLPVLEHT